MRVAVATYRSDFAAVMAGAAATTAETALLAACQTGEFADAGDGLPPDTTDPARRVRAGLIRFLLLGGDADHRPHPKGVQLKGAWLDGVLDFESCATPLDLRLVACLLPQPLVLRGARLGGLYLPGCRAAQGLDLQCARFAGGVFLRGGFHASGEVNLRGARITGQLACNGGRFDGARGMALSCEGMTVGASVFLSDGFHASGEVNLRGARITGQLACVGGRFDGAGGMALSCEGMTVGADVFLRGGFHASGEVNLVRASITGQLACDGGRFDGAGGRALIGQAATVGADVLLTQGFHASGEVNLVRASITGQLACNGGRFDGAGGMALMGQAATVGADVFLSDGFHASGLVDFTRARITGNLMVQQAQLAGGIDLQQAQVGAALFWQGLSGSTPLVDLTEAHLGSLRDQPGGWDGVQTLRLAGLVYDRLGAGNGVDDRLKWLERGDDPKSAAFNPQPYSQLARVLTAAGQRRAAARVREARERKLRRAEWQRARSTLPWRGRLLGALGAYLWGGVYGALFGYGHAPARVLWWVLGLIGITGLFFGHVYALGQFAPNSAVILTSDDWLAAVARSDLACALASNCVKPLHIWAGYPDILPPLPPAVDYETFNRWLYATDLFLPLDTIGQTEAWAPSRDRGGWGWWAYYARMPIQLAGWLIVAVTAAVLTGLVGKHDD
ncbi:MAG: hypothetical protein Q8Q26_15445 [Pseudorhodobacter sp.]|nr:hypothetical protein [Pseudorhodobacter sp.]